MIRGVLLIIFFIILYAAVRTVFRSALKAYQEKDQRARIMGDDMVLDPQCRTYVLKERAVTRRIGGATHSFCSEGCARRYEEENRG